MKKQAIILSIRESVASQINNTRNYMHDSDAAYLGTDLSFNPRYITLLPNKIFTANKKNTFCVKNEIYNNVYEYLIFLLKKEIDIYTNHPIKISHDSSSLANLTDEGYYDYENDVIPKHFNKPMRALNNFIEDSNWNLFTIESRGYDIFITKKQDWRILEWERMTAPQEE